MTGGLSQSSLRAALADPFALRAALALDAAFNLWICGNGEDFLSTDPLAPSVRNPVPFSHTALLTRIEESSAAGSVGEHTHGQPCPDTHTPPPSFCFTSITLHSTARPRLLQSPQLIFDLTSSEPIYIPNLRLIGALNIQAGVSSQCCYEKSNLTIRTER